MSKSTLTKIAVLALLGGAAFAGRSGEKNPLIFGLLAFGIFNLLVSVPGTTWVRRTAVAASLVGLLLPGNAKSLVVVLAWLVWPPAFLVTWAVSGQRNATQDVGLREESEGGNKARVTMAATIVAVAMGSIFYRLVVAHDLQQTAALFIGVPALLAIVVVFFVSPRSGVGVACKAVTIGLLVSMLFLWEGVLCVVMSAPLFYGVAVVIGTVVSKARRTSGKPTDTAFFCLALLALIPMSLEGVTAATSFDRNESVEETRIVHASPDAVQRALFQPPRFHRALPLYLRAGFPVPISARIEGNSVGAQWVIRFLGGEMRLDGIAPQAGNLVLKIEEMQPGLIRWRAISDDSHMPHFLGWQEASVRWEKRDEQTTAVTWTLRYRRNLDPAWYFAPWEHYAVRLAADYLIDSVATP
jgi:hypothetical protein